MTRWGLALLLTLAGCSSSSKSAAPKGDASTASGLPDGALVYQDALPACHWPSSVSASRTFLACANCFSSTGGMCSIGVGDNATDCQSCGACVMACEPDQYAVVDEGWDESSYADAGVVNQTLPAGCVGALPVMANYLENDPTSTVSFIVNCCPCQ